MTPINVLVVDDFPQNLVASEATLVRPGLQVLKAASGDEALELLLVHEVALALIDVQMPGMDGFELAELVRGNPRTAEIPIIFMTAAPEEAERSFRGYRAGAVDFLNKPINSEVLRGKVEVFAQLHAQKIRIREQVEQLRHALQVNEMFVAVLGHDLRTPLQAVLHGAELISRLGSEARVIEAAQRIVACGERMEKMVKQLLDVAQLRATAIALYPERSNVTEVCMRIIDEIEHVATAARIELAYCGDLDAVLDPDRVSQVLSNLIGNALQHGTPDAPVLVHLDGGRKDEIVISVRNEGTIAHESMAGLFEPFAGAGHKRSGSDGLGLGLYIVRRFVEAHGGRVTLRSNSETGTCFEVVLPRICPGAMR